MAADHLPPRSHKTRDMGDDLVLSRYDEWTWETEDGRFHRALELSSTDLDPMVLYIDPETHRIVRQTYVAGGPGNPLIEELFAEYRPVDGVQIAFSATVRRGDLTVLERNVVELRINDGLDQALFKRP